MTACQQCRKKWTGKRMEHCTVCHQTFSGTISGDKHRTGQHGVLTGPDRRRCRTVEEMAAKGLVQNERDVWTSGGTSPWSQAEGTSPSP